MGRVRGIRRLRRRVRIGAPDPALSPVSGMAAVSELVERLGVVRRLDAAIGLIKTRDRGHTGGELLCPPDGCPSNLDDRGLATAIIAGQQDTYRHLWVRVAPLLADTGLT